MGYVIYLLFIIKSESFIHKISSLDELLSLPNMSLVSLVQNESHHIREKRISEIEMFIIFEDGRKRK